MRGVNQLLSFFKSDFTVVYENGIDVRTKFNMTKVIQNILRRGTVHTEDKSEGCDNKLHIDNKIIGQMI